MLKGKGGEKWFWDRGKIISTSPILGMWIDGVVYQGVRTFKVFKVFKVIAY
jgi:hypothetical protein